MDIQIDSREKAKAIHKIQAEFDRQNINYFSSKLLVGDYMNLDNPRLIIDRKQDIQELVGNINTTKEHERFRNELLRAIKANIKLVILIEHGPEITCLDDVWFFYQPEMKRYRWKTVEILGKKKKISEPYTQNAIDGKKIYKSMCTIRDRYNVRFEFCNKEDTGKRIIEILGGESLD